ncbi:hypothetical protein L1987_37795 [Smallanthus sonchifolius]|uniref:Uncharacterized protein n=1 Tax=Smallanthus sonchifolius TaxID=185202 RepID=A0ACB9HJW6_9ASTR|nr:hypothetical protein L1987_37795 [Smallanthus sonchifolius]
MWKLHESKSIKSFISSLRLLNFVNYLRTCAIWKGDTCILGFLSRKAFRINPNQPRDPYAFLGIPGQPCAYEQSTCPALMIPPSVGGIHLEDIVAHVSQAFLAEVHHEDVIESGSSDSDSTDSGILHESEEPVPQKSETKFSNEDLLNDGAARKVTEKIVEMLAEGNAFMADAKQVKQVDSCLKCIDFEFKITGLCDDNTNFIFDMKAMYTFNQILKENETILKAKTESLKDDIKVLQTKVNEQAFHLNVSYSEYEKKINELAVSLTEVIGGVCSCPSFDDTEIGGGVGYCPPFNANYTPCLIEEVLVEDLEPKTVFNINLVTGNDMVYDDSTDDEVFDSEKVEVIVNDCKYVEPVVMKTVTRDMCILTKPDDVSEQPKPKSTLNQLNHFKNVDSGEKKPSVQTASDTVKIVKKIESIAETTQPKEKLSRPQRRRRNKRLRKLLEQLVENDKVEVMR